MDNVWRLCAQPPQPHGQLEKEKQSHNTNLSAYERNTKRQQYINQRALHGTNLHSNLQFLTSQPPPSLGAISYSCPSRSRARLYSLACRSSRNLQNQADTYIHINNTHARAQMHCTKAQIERTPCRSPALLSIHKVGNNQNLLGMRAYLHPPSRTCFSRSAPHYT